MPKYVADFLVAALTCQEATPKKIADCIRAIPAAPGEDEQERQNGMGGATQGAARDGM